MKKALYIFLVSLIIFSCKKDAIKKPENFISKDKMIDLLVDMKIASKARSIKNRDSKKNLNYMSFVFEKYQIDSTQFKENNVYYVHHIEQYQEIYAAVQLQLKDSLAKYENIIKVRDSINREKKSILKDKKMMVPELKNSTINKNRIKKKVNKIKKLN